MKGCPHDEVIIGVVLFLRAHTHGILLEKAGTRWGGERERGCINHDGQSSRLASIFNQGLREVVSTQAIQMV